MSQVELSDLQVLEQIIYSRVNVQTVQPKRKDSGFTFSFRIKLFNHWFLAFF